MKSREERTMAAAVTEIGPVVDWTCDRLAQWVDVEAARIGLTEAITNALVHGVYAISGAIRDDLDRYLAAIEECSARGDLTPLTVSITRREDCCEVSIRWRGTPCPSDRRVQPSAQLDPWSTSGLGMHVIYESCHEVAWSPDGLTMQLIYRRPDRDEPEHHHHVREEAPQ